MVDKRIGDADECKYSFGEWKWAPALAAHTFLTRKFSCSSYEEVEALQHSFRAKPKFEDFAKSPDRYQCTFDNLVASKSPEQLAPHHVRHLQSLIQRLDDAIYRVHAWKNCVRQAGGESTR